MSLSPKVGDAAEGMTEFYIWHERGKAEAEAFRCWG